MRRLFSLCLTIGIILGFSTASFAAFSSVSKITNTAAVTLSGGSVAVSLQLVNIAGGTTTQIWWNPSDISLGSTQWDAAEAYILLTSTLTNAAGGIQIYTDNKAGDASPAYTGIANPAGLVGYQAGTPSASSSTLSMCWRVVETSTTTLTIRRGATGYPDRLWAQQLGDQFPCFLWMMDRNTSGFVDGYDYATIKDAIRGAQFAEASFGSMSSPDYIYIGADFTGALGGRTYKTSKLCVEAFTE